MDPWNCTSNKDVNTCFEDDFKPTINHTLPDSEKYLESLENKLNSIKNDPDLLKQLQEKREACMRHLLSGDNNEKNFQQEENPEPINQSIILRAIAPERQAINSGEIIELVKHLQDPDLR